MEALFFKKVLIWGCAAGKIPFEFSAAYDNYMDWLKKIAAMNSNTVEHTPFSAWSFMKHLHNTTLKQEQTYLSDAGVWADETGKQ